MNRESKKVLSVLIVSLAALASACTNRETISQTTIDSVFVADTTAIDSLVQDTVSIDTLAHIVKDTVLDNAARFIAGLPQLDSNSFSSLQQDQYWKDYQQSMDQNWEKMYTTRLSKMEEWEQSHLSTAKQDSLALFYPFSGPDFLHAFYLFPGTRNYILVALEPIKEVAPLDTISVSDRDQFLDSLGNSLRDIFKKSYFITTHMQQDLKQIKGVLPPLYFFIERTGHEILTQEFFKLDSAGFEQPIPGRQLHWQKIPGVRITFRMKGSEQIKTLHYFSVSIANAGLRERPEFTLFLKRKTPFNTFVKSASYLMHRDAFTTIRNFIIDNSQTLFQDDTGIPYRHFKKRLEWTGTFYGDYVKPVKDFEEALFQIDLDSAYRQAPKNSLPFSLGYHWSTARQNYMLFTRKTLSNSR